MSTISRQLVINHFFLPKEVIEIIKEYTFHKIKRIPENDERYNKLYTIEPKIYDPTTNHTYVYLNGLYSLLVYILGMLVVFVMCF
jgi:hypothetical protein